MASTCSTVEALSVASFVNHLATLPHETRATITATEHGAPWATVTISPTTDTARSVFPCYLNSSTIGDTRKRGQSGVMVQFGNPTDALRLVVERARRMAAA